MLSKRMQYIWFKSRNRSTTYHHVPWPLFKGQCTHGLSPSTIRTPDEMQAERKLGIIPPLPSQTSRKISCFLSSTPPPPPFIFFFIFSFLTSLFRSQKSATRTDSECGKRSFSFPLSRRHYRRKKEVDLYQQNTGYNRKISL